MKTYQNYRLSFSDIPLCFAVFILVCSTGARSYAQTTHPKRIGPAKPDVATKAIDPAPVQGPTFVETINFIRSKLRRDNTETLFACNNGYGLVQWFLENQPGVEKPPQDQEILVRIHHWPIAGNDKCDDDVTWKEDVSIDGRFHPSKVAIGSITIAQSWLASYKGRHIEEFYLVDVPLTSSEPNLFMRDSSGKVPTTHIVLYLPDQQTAERIKNALIGLAKLCGAKEEVY